MLILFALLLTFFIPGLGHVFLAYYPSWHFVDKRILKRGLIFAVAYLISAMLGSIIIGFFLMPIVWIWGMIDVYKTAKTIRSYSNR